MSEDCEEDQRNFFDVFVEALEGADRVIVETRNALDEFDAHYMTAPKLLTESKALKAQIGGLLRIVGDKHDLFCRIEELEAQLECALDHMENMNQLWKWTTIHKADESKFLDIQNFLADNGRSVQHGFGLVKRYE